MNDLTASHRLVEMKVTGGFLDQLRIQFSPGLNCIIGGRGAGKTTVLELIRFVLDIPCEPGVQKRFEELVKANLGPGRVELSIQTKDRLRYSITRACGEPPLVLTEAGQPTDLNPRAGGLFHADLFSLNQIENVADCPASQLALIDSFDLPAIIRHNNAIRRLVDALDANARELIPADARLFALREETVELATIEEQLKAGGQAANPEAEPAREAARLKGLRERERTALSEFGDEFKDYIRTLAGHKGWLSAMLTPRITREFREGPNGDFFARVDVAFADIAARLDFAVEKALAICAEGVARHEELARSLADLHARQEMAYREMIERQKTLMDAANERSALERRRNELLRKKTEMDALAQKVDGLQAARKRLLSELSEERGQRFRLRSDLARRVNDTLMPDIRVNILQDGNREEYDSRLEAWLKGSKVQKTSRAALVKNLWPRELARLCLERDANALVTRGEISEWVAQAVFDYLGKPEILCRMEGLETADDPVIELNDGGTYKRAWALSTGQKCTAVLPILLMEHERPLLVDQPEDNLDNRFVSDKVVKTLRAVKERRQIIFTTHNPNIPVLGEADAVFVMDSDGQQGGLNQWGTVDDCKQAIINLLEGGADAFRRRARRYA
jgi:ABC-type lipoprotein export system ATPase subunit